MYFYASKGLDDNQLQLPVNTMPSFMCPIIGHYYLM
ncbi:hypothetical protein FNL37_0263 [Methylovorus glucosotrophus]|jgi:hypothetical protein|nr:hypothetical protein FNL37_0263 [Methylovorus glucosotrophus]